MRSTRARSTSRPGRGARPTPFLPAGPVTLECLLEQVRGPIGRGKAKATVNGELAVRGTLTFAVEQ